MTLVDDVLRVLPELRLQAESMMVDKADIVRLSDPVFDPETGLVTSPETVIYAGRRCWLRMPTAMETERLFGEEQITATRYAVSFAHDTVGIKIDDVIRIIESDDADALTRNYRVIIVPTRTILPFKSFGCEVVE